MMNTATNCRFTQKYDRYKQLPITTTTTRRVCWARTEIILSLRRVQDNSLDSSSQSTKRRPGWTYGTREEHDNNAHSGIMFCLVRTARSRSTWTSVTLLSGTSDKCWGLKAPMLLVWNTSLKFERIRTSKDTRLKSYLYTKCKSLQKYLSNHYGISNILGIHSNTTCFHNTSNNPDQNFDRALSIRNIYNLTSTMPIAQTWCWHCQREINKCAYNIRTHHRTKTRWYIRDVTYATTPGTDSIQIYYVERNI